MVVFSGIRTRANAIPTQARYQLYHRAVYHNTYSRKIILTLFMFIIVKKYNKIIIRQNFPNLPLKIAPHYFLWNMWIRLWIPVCQRYRLLFYIQITAAIITQGVIYINYWQGIMHIGFTTRQLDYVLQRLDFTIRHYVRSFIGY